MKTSDFDFSLPEKYIAQNPVIPRDQCKLMVYDCARDKVFHKKFFEIESYLNENDLLVLNRSKVIPARIKFLHNDKEKEIFLLKKIGDSVYETMVRPGKFFKIGASFDIKNKVKGTVKDVLADGLRIISFEPALDGYLDILGEMPLPPYIKNSKSSDEYQTVYAKEKGSVAAPTAGLHFTERLFYNLKKKGVEVEEVVLHVGRGTFLPVKTNQLSDHKMHAEEFFIDQKTAENLNKAVLNKKNIVAVGTTSVRVLESAYKNDFSSQNSSTDIFIYPGKYHWKVVNKLITNFHLPKSTLIMLVASFLESKGVKHPVEKIISLYELAKKENYRFYSFGDAMYLF